MHIPTATYRLQFNPSFGFSQARQILPYLKRLGISDIYASPIFKAKAGSTHGYDVIEPNCLNPELGSADEFDLLLKAVRDLEMGWVQDIVPNHMAFDGQNSWLMDVLEKGKNSAYQKFFDIEWKDTYQGLKGKVLAPFLGQFYSRCLENKEIQLRFTAGSLTIHYFDLCFPLKLETYGDVLLFDYDKFRKESGKTMAVCLKYLNVVRKFERISSRKRKVDVKEVKKELWRIYQNSTVIKNFVDHNIRTFNGCRGFAKSFDLLDQLLSKQFFRLAFWKFGAEEINYRRFFSINQLISMKVENRKVFDQTHRFISELVQQKKISGLRVDHIDGLYDPQKYLQRLREFLKAQYVVVEKILEQDESIPSSWPVEGTTGYDFLNYVNGVFVDVKSEQSFSEYYQQIVKEDITFDDVVIAKKMLIVGKHMAGDVDNLAHHMQRISCNNKYGRDITSYGLKRALVEVLAVFPRYRTYIDGAVMRDEDRIVIIETIKKAKERNPGLVYEFDFIADILLLNFNDQLTAQEKNSRVHFVQRFQQFTGPLMAKGFEDTTLYIYNRLVSLNEVGGNPIHFGVMLKDFHRFNQERQSSWPYTMSSTATHDTKRGEDVRVRINVLSEIPEKWISRVRSWRKSNQGNKVYLAGKFAPDDNDEYFLYQTLIGGYPFEESEHRNFKQRLKNYIIKAVREAKVHTAWIQPDEKYENAYLEFIDRILEPSAKNVFLKDFLKFQEEISYYGIFNSLSQVLIKLTSPGVPDFYQGCELWDFNFVDPDNRRPVNFKQRHRILMDIDNRSKDDHIRLIHELLQSKESGNIKIYLISRILHLRKIQKEVFQQGSYTPLTVTGKFKEHIIAYVRESKGKCVVTIVPRFLTKIVGYDHLPIGHIWGNTSVLVPQGGHLVDWITGNAFNKKKIFVKSLFKFFPGAVLTNKSV